MQKYKNVLSDHNTHKYQNQILNPRIIDLKGLKGQNNKPDGDGTANHQTFQVHGEKQEK